MLGSLPSQPLRPRDVAAVAAEVVVVDVDADAAAVVAVVEPAQTSPRDAGSGPLLGPIIQGANLGTIVH